LQEEVPIRSWWYHGSYNVGKNIYKSSGCAALIQVLGIQFPEGS
jgi:hypothetical protein